MIPTDHASLMNAAVVSGRNSALESMFQGLLGLGVFVSVSLLYIALLAIEPLLDSFKKTARTE
jgi:hypothetical protein